MDREGGGGEERPWPYLLGHTPMERLFISPSHLQHSDTAAVKHSLPHDTSSRRDDSESKEVHKSYNQTSWPAVRAGTSVHQNTCDSAVQKKLLWLVLDPNFSQHSITVDISAVPNI